MNNALPLQQYTLGEGVTAFSTTRQGGVSTGDAYASFNINPYCGDAAESVDTNRALLCQTLGIDDSHLVMPHQTHGIDSRIISAEFCSLPASVRAMILEGVDAVMTNEKGLCIGVSTADCVPVLLFDPVHQAVCAVHAGWRGTVARVTHKAVVDMKTAFGTLPADLKAVIGPAISMSAFEVGDEVYEQFAAADFDLNTAAER
ncbi:MAG: polyphenol oxidase family protein, partial [Prevotella sp.]|nr:polyphenol oxidase family protein [Prevotella sp.]